MKFERKFKNIYKLPFDELINGEGFFIKKIISSDDLKIIKSFVIESFKKNFNIDGELNFHDIINMHKNQTWEINRPPLTVEDRLLSREAATTITNQDWLKLICENLNYKVIEDFGLGYPSMMWRITRPNRDEDFRPVHRDVWFRLCNGEELVIDESKPLEIQTIKIWISLHNVRGKSGLLVSAKSHKDQNIKFSKIEQDGFIKPKISKEDLKKIKTFCVGMDPGDCIFFGERLLHGGAPNESSDCRISLEICLCPKNYQPLNHIKV